MSDQLTTAEAKALAGELKNIHEGMKSRLDELQEGLDGVKRDESLERMHDRMDEIETKLARPELDRGDDEGSDEARAAFRDFVRKGATPDNMKALSRGTDTAGGFLVPEGIAKELIKNVVEISPIRALASSVTITEGDSYPYARRTSEAAAGWTSEGGTRAESTNPAYGSGRIPLHEMYLMIDINRQLLDMAGFDVEGEWMGEAVEQKAKLEGAAFCTADGNGKPQGLVHANAGVSSTNSGHASQVTADGLISLVHAPKAAYLQGAAFVMNRTTLKLCRQLKDAQNQYLWAPGFGTALKDGAPATLLGYRYEIAQDMPDVAAGTYPIAFGDFKQGYKIVDHTKVHQIRDEVTQAATGNVRFWVTGYVGGQVVKTEALQLQKIAA